jgi:hypothetical protein
MKKKISKKSIEKKLDLLWSEAVKIKAGYVCEYCKKSENLNSHHIISRANKTTRWDLENGVCLDVSHHTFSNVFSAHLTPLEFVDWIYETRGKKEINQLRKESQKKADLSIPHLLEIKAYLEEYIKNNR